MPVPRSVHVRCSSPAAEADTSGHREREFRVNDADRPVRFHEDGR
ncbi:hypothetical protein BN2537_9483 [Streptomyces venezuelae]|nr:hypothetical protein BN2537_9483 [Streptomyces venezuelae]